MEVTMTTPNALQVIADATTRFGDKILMGVGSVHRSGNGARGGPSRARNLSSRR